MKPTYDHPYPRVGVSVLVRKQGKILLGLRTGAHGAETWAPPGGKLDLGESWEDCAQRETNEETGLEIANVKFLAVNNDVFETEGLHYVTIVVQADWTSGEPQLLEPHKCREWKWFNPRLLPEPLFLVLVNLQKYHPEILSKF